MTAFTATLMDAAVSNWTLSSALYFLAAVVLAQVTGALWYSPLLFQDAWAKRAFPTAKTSKDYDRIRNSFFRPELAYGSALLGSTCAFFLVRIFIELLGIETAIDGAVLGVTVASMGGLFGMMHSFFEGKPFMIYVINQGYHAVCFMNAGALLALSMKKLEVDG